MIKASPCKRCYQPTNTTTMSMFNTEMICMDCVTRERHHSKYAEARDAEAAAVSRGNMNFPGIGCPADLYQPQKKELNEPS